MQPHLLIHAHCGSDKRGWLYAFSAVKHAVEDNAERDLSLFPVSLAKEKKQRQRSTTVAEDKSKTGVETAIRPKCVRSFAKSSSSLKLRLGSVQSDELSSLGSRD